MISGIFLLLGDDQTTDTVGREARAARTIVHTVETTFVIDYKDFTK